jgi:hypothetical protein
LRIADWDGILVPSERCSLLLLSRTSPARSALTGEILAWRVAADLD